MIAYTDLITSEHSDKPKFNSLVELITSASNNLVALYDSVPDLYDIDTAVGKQLDVVGEWVGRSRLLAIPLTGVYFSWDDTVETGWGSGVWQGTFDPTSGLTKLPDDIYRRLLKAKIAANNWDGTIPSAYAIWETLFTNGEGIIIQDNQDMSFTMAFFGTELSIVDKSIISQGYLPLKSEGVRIADYFLAFSSAPIFCWGSESGTGSVLAGWGTGEWPTTL